MRTLFLWFFVLIAGMVIYSCKQKTAIAEEQGANTLSNAEKARIFCQENIIVDTHIDAPYRIEKQQDDISTRTEGGHFDYVRAKQGGLNAIFMAIYIDPAYQENDKAFQRAENLISLLEKFTQDWPDKFMIATSVSDVKRQFEQGLMSFAMGMENGASIENDIRNIAHFYDRGIRYITLTHGKWNQICDSSYDPDKHWNGLSPFGREVITEMNRLGMMVDISHVSDSAFYQILEITKAPVIASHSSCRHFTPGMERNMSDDMIIRLAENGGVIQINFGSFFINGEFYVKMNKEWALEDSIGHSMTREELLAFRERYMIENNVPEVQMSEVADHIDHVVNLVGIDYVGLGSDFDGVNNLPTGLEDVSMYPALIEELLNRGYTEDDIKKICHGNIFRVWETVANMAASKSI